MSLVKREVLKFADVIIPLAVDGVYTYSIPASLEDRVERGVSVLVPFVGSKKYSGIVCRVHDREPVEYKTKMIEGLTDEYIRFSENHLRFLFWVSEYYMATPGEVLRAALPVIFRLESVTGVMLTESEIDYEGLTGQELSVLNYLQPGRYVVLSEIEKSLNIRGGVAVVKSLLAKGYVQVRESVDEVFKIKTEKWVKWAKRFGEEELNGVLDTLKRAPAQYRMLCRWIEIQSDGLEKQQFIATTGESASVLKSLCERDVLAVEERKVSRLGSVSGEDCRINALSDEQQSTFQQITSCFETKSCVLLQGVTSSGKTEVYIHLIQEYISQGKQVLYMLPEIALTVQIIRRLQQAFGDRIGIYHSGMPDNMRAELWCRQCSDDPYPLVLGVRSSVFLPFKHLGLIIVDEEHDSSYKQKEPAPRYNGRDSAVMLGSIYGAKVLLGSATPSFESYEHALSGKYGYVLLKSRYGNIQLPELLYADVAEYRRKKQMKGSFSPLLYEEMKQVLETGKQVILFQNRRGYSTYMQCDKCGEIVKCAHCDVSMTYYKQRDLMSCRYCGSLKKVNGLCEHCREGHYQLRTPGTERIEEEVMQLFPGVRVARMDLDAMSSRLKYRSVIDDFEQGRTDVLIGTQMVSKGLDFGNVKLVGVMDADSMVHFPDFRAEERAYCMLMQVGGRSGRKGERGKVVIQTADGKNRIYVLLAQGDYDTFYRELSADRSVFGYPPYSRLIRMELRHKDVITLRNLANTLAGRLRMKLGKRVYGPAVPDVSKIGGMNRIHLIIKIEPGRSYAPIKTFLAEESVLISRNPLYKGVRIIYDVDPA